eukprot:snap_masked-scaffold_8-processed-gene-5.28-mRNA-1 protein AED:0.30 eAED:0.30 QI:0/0/0/0.5/1/1/2/0/173
MLNELLQRALESTLMEQHEAVMKTREENELLLKLILERIHGRNKLQDTYTNELSQKIEIGKKRKRSGDKNVKPKFYRKLCEKEDCTKYSQGSSPFCFRHGGGYRCSAPGCNKGSRNRSRLCIFHGASKKCKIKKCAVATKSGIQLSSLKSRNLEENGNEVNKEKRTEQKKYET